MGKLDKVRRIHFIGIGGIGVSGAARLALARGFEVTGSDVRASQLTESIAAQGAQVHIGHDPALVHDVDLVAVSTAIPDENVELVAAREAGVPIAHRSEILSELINGYPCTIGVTGTHGKGTTASMLTWILDCAGRDPGFVIGGLLNNYGTNTRAGDGKVMVVEVDESDGSHERIPTSHLICNFLEPDHLNYYRDLDHIIDSMVALIERRTDLANVYVNLDCAGNRSLVERVGRRTITYGLVEDADVRGVLLGRAQYPIQFEVFRHGERLGTAALSIPGRYNVTNALGALSVALELGVPFATAAEALESFKGLENRFTIERAGDVTIVKDYISHPTGIRRVLESAADLTNGRIFSIWKPYRYTLLDYLQEEYATAFEGSHEVLITTMYAAEEDPIEGIDTEFIVNKIRATGMNVSFIPKDADIVAALESRVRPGDKAIFFGGDDFFRMADAWAEQLRRTRPQASEEALKESARAI